MQILHFNWLRYQRTTRNRRMKGVVSKETVVLRRWGSSIQKFSFINGVDNVNWPRTEILKAEVSSVNPSLALRSDEGLTLETSAFRISLRWPIYIINSVDKTKFLYTSNGPRVAKSATLSFVLFPNKYLLNLHLLTLLLPFLSDLLGDTKTIRPFGLKGLGFASWAIDS